MAPGAHGLGKQCVSYRSQLPLDSHYVVAKSLAIPDLSLVTHLDSLAWLTGLQGLGWCSREFIEDNCGGFKAHPRFSFTNQPDSPNPHKKVCIQQCKQQKFHERLKAVKARNQKRAEIRVSWSQADNSYMFSLLTGCLEYQSRSSATKRSHGHVIELITLHRPVPVSLVPEWD